MSANSTNSTTPQPKMTLQLADGVRRPMTAEEIAIPDMEKPCLSIRPYDRYRRKCLKCKGQLYVRTLGMGIIDLTKLSTYFFGTIYCLNGCDPACKPTKREQEWDEYYKQHTTEYIYYTQEYIDWVAAQIANNIKKAGDYAN